MVADNVHRKLNDFRTVLEVNFARLAVDRKKASFQRASGKELHQQTQIEMHVLFAPRIMKFKRENVDEIQKSR